MQPNVARNCSLPAAAHAIAERARLGRVMYLLLNRFLDRPHGMDRMALAIFLPGLPNERQLLGSGEWSFQTGLEAPAIRRLHDFRRLITIQPDQGGGILPQIGIPKGGR